jgi:tRNA threonylcarbamoyl adenosine modification protein YeaZ/ribosomal-protein-alanine acetyltransferase
MCYSRKRNDMTLLAIDTCLGSCSAALFDPVAARIVGERCELMERGHAERIAPMVQSLLQTAGESVSRILVTNGPGTFTGIRIGLALVKGIALARNLPITAIGTMVATAVPFLGRGNDVLVCHKSGGTRQNFVQQFDPTGIAKNELQLLLPQETKIDDGEIVVGTGIQSLSAQISNETFFALPNAASFAPFAASLPFGAGTVPQPLYVREADAKPAPPVNRAPLALKKETVSASAAALLADMHARCFDHPWTEQSFAEMLATPGTLAFIARTEIEPAGFVIVRIAADEAEILSLCALPALRKRGVGISLLNEAVRALKMHGVSSLFLEVASDNEPALALYRSGGFVQSGLRRAYYQRSNGPAMDAILMRREIS